MFRVDKVIAYHATSIKFDKFDTNKINFQDVKIPGFWFSTNRSEVENQYGDIILKCEVELTNPISFIKVTINAEQLSKLSGYSLEKCENALKRFTSDYGIIKTIIPREPEKYITFVKLLKELTGLDGYEYSNNIIVFQPEQIKILD